MILKNGSMTGPSEESEDIIDPNISKLARCALRTGSDGHQNW